MKEICVTCTMPDKLSCKDIITLFQEFLSTKFTVMRTITHIFDEVSRAFTFVAILGESHAVLHTYPENYRMYVNIGICKNVNYDVICRTLEIFCKTVGSEVKFLRVIERNV